MSLKIPSQSKVASRTSLGARSSKSMLNAMSGLIRSRSRLAGESRTRLKAGSRVGYQDGDGDGEEWLQAKDPVKPDNQLDLTEEELKEEFTRIIRGDNPNAPDNIVRFSFKEGEFKQQATVEQLAMHFSLDGNLIHVESDEARRQQTRFNIRTRKPATVEAGTDAEAPPAEDEGVEEGAEGDKGEGAEEDADEEGDGAEEPEESEPVEETVSEAEPKKLRNQFNFSERASQSFNYTQKDKGMMTVPTPRATFSSNATQWEIYDAYRAYLDKKNAEKDKKKQRNEPVASKSQQTRKVTTDEDASIWAVASTIVKLQDAKKLERMVVQNAYDDVAQDFKFWEDESDQFKSDGSLLPLWKFSNDLCKKKCVTCLSFNPEYHDVMISGYGSYDYAKNDDGGVIVCSSFKNHLHPEILIKTDSAVLCIDTLKTSTQLIVAGFQDGMVAVYDLADDNNKNKPTHCSTALTGKHTDPVWDVKWQGDDLAKRHTFFSVSSDGLVRGWTLMLNELVYRNVITLQNPESPEAPLFAGTCFAFSAKEEHLYLVGTEEGKVMKCSKAYSTKYLQTYDDAHSMAIYALRWNPFHHGVFATASADWSVKVWDHEYPASLFEFDLGSPVGDMAWAPYSSTVFGAVTADGRFFLFDLSVSKTDPVCVQPIIKKGKLTHVAFNPTYPVVVVGDDRGNITSLKLSPNLRKNIGAKGFDPANEVDKLDKLLDSMKELDIQTGQPLALIE